MNNRIKELAEKADILFLRSGVIQPGRGEKDIEKLVELVVYECLPMVNDIRKEDEILHHFGIIDRSRF